MATIRNGRCYFSAWKNVDYPVGGKKNKNQTGRATMEKTHINSETHTDFKDLWPALLKY